ncbi:MAG: DUF3565 domain-containing protein [Acidobacteria bacterium]|nr:DUF3565 domain-containing protein [Acidobacteriota bacterium]
MNRTILSFYSDDQGDWIAELSCGHRQHVRHRPPFKVRPWVLDHETRCSRLGSSLSCPLCDRAELPNGLRHVQSTPRWDEHTLPARFQCLHRLPEDTWGRITVHRGRLHFTSRGEVDLDVIIDSSTMQAIPPGLDHSLGIIGPVSMSIDFFSIDRGEVEDHPDYENRRPEMNQEMTSTASHEGGETACWAHLVCPECGGIVGDVVHSHAQPENQCQRTE